MSKTRSTVVMCLGLFLAGATFVDSLDGSITEHSQFGAGRTIEKSLEPSAFRRAVLFGVILGLGVAGGGFYSLRRGN
ncbi:MAG: hypothetical protein K0U93_00365 [Gammaproteobacteria bacterium]|nr:hypothetical protein [Gammaproteobacteria bacterium]